ncbi:hypothetical protein CJD36_011000 [Flavipsychrobacter stenotrophus]|uniref:PA14 domain-containing protein n=1 Tax=Flavipsychrobacter stenotrophus TaxID=2077091 RepID=A0A2S7SVE0_9BACT|nr:hypothetical protein [Flavipsychrobacter stenotrophus]PQJ10496.1 hypothetical protein CJD36_011000 [Flavipsychrobacter stenotrophus]
MESYSNKIKRTAWILLAVFTIELLAPNVSLALTTGPSQPEVQGFEPVGTTDMVDMFSGDFVYNIPLMDVEGYPMNISYHGGVTMEQEASWVGLGWNINPGVINRNVRGVSDDFNGDSILKNFHIKDEKNLRVGIGGTIELAGMGDPFPLNLTGTAGGDLNISNYRGVSMDFTYGANVNIYKCASVGVNVGIGSQTGGSLDYNASFSTSRFMSKEMAGVGAANIAVGGGYSTRSGIKDLSLSLSVVADDKGHSLSSSYNIPIGMRNYVPVITNSSTMTTIHGRVKIGPEMLGGYLSANISAMCSKLHFNNDASRSAYGYLYLQNARQDNSSILDFTRDKDGSFNKTMQYLPTPSMTYDIYSVSGQGTGGMFRPFRNDFGNVYDPYTYSSTSSEGGQAEIGPDGNTFEVGFDFTHSGTQITSGPWLNYQRSGTMNKGFTSKKPGSIFENVYFKQAGELTEVDSNYFEQIGKKNLITPFDVMNLPQTKAGSQTKRDPRANLIHFHTAEEDMVAGVSNSRDIINYENAFDSFGTPVVTKIKRVGKGRYQRKKDHLSEIVQTQKDGRKYIYGIPAINSIQREVTFSVDPSHPANTVNLTTGIVDFESSDLSTSNHKGRDNYYSSNITPAFTHSYLLTSVLSTDYVDVTGNGISDDDLGSYTKFNYCRTDSDYRWVSPYSAGITKGQYNPGFWSDKKDDKASVVCGSRDQWYLHSIETKNYFAEFYTSPRQDAKGISVALLNAGGSDLYNTGKVGASESYQLDSIKLYNKHDRFINRATATPIKTIYFAYSYSLCDSAPNSSSGKLTLEKIYFKNGSSQKSMISPYRFSYAINPAYNLAAKDRWGNFKPNTYQFTNYEFPYVNQLSNNDSLAGAWSLNKIILPSGGVISATYESDDYAFVQDKPANEMFMVKGVGNSPAYVAGKSLYQNLHAPNLYLYFKRQPAKEIPGLDFRANYLGRNFTPGGENITYFNFNVNLTGDIGTFEQIKGYANATDGGICSNDASYGYIRISSVETQGGGATLNPITYTAINTSRYNLPQVIYPGSDPDESDLLNILMGLKGASDELRNRFKSPVLNLAKQGYARVADLSKSYIRLQSPGLSKKGGGQRVKSLKFSDQWQKLSGGNSEEALYGKTYDYTVDDPVYGKISSGVASYEPMVGGDENPFRLPVKYTIQAGNAFPPNDPVDLYQELPIGESLFPPASVGYSNVTVRSIHANVGRSSQGEDKYEFYTAKDFPVQLLASPKDPDPNNHYDFFTQRSIYKVTQGYTLILNDMHGKPKKVEHNIYNANSSTPRPVSYTIYNYRQKGNDLDNNVPCLVNVGANMVVRNRQLGVEEDVTLDSRQKNEITTNTTVNGNLNCFYLFIPIALPLIYPWISQSQNEFQSAVVGKVVQQYGIIDNVVSYSEGAVTTVQNEIYDPKTGEVIVSSINNEYQDKEYNTSIPAYWAYKAMGGAYNNIGYKDTGTITVGPNHIGTLNMTNTAPLTTGDELSVIYTPPTGGKRYATAYVMGVVPQYTLDSFLNPIATSDTFMHTHWRYAPRYCFNHHPFNVVGGITVDSILCCTTTHGNPVMKYLRTELTTANLMLADTCFNSNFTPPSLSAFFTGDGFYHESSTNVCCSGVPYDELHSGSNIPITVTISGVSGGPYTVSGHVALSLTGGGTATRDFIFSGPIVPGWIVPSIDSTLDTTYSYSAPYRHYVHFSHSSCTGVNILPRFPLNTSGWDIGSTLSHASIEVISSGHKNMLGESIENYSSMSSPVSSAGTLNTYLTNLISLKGRTFCDSNTAIPHRYIANADTVNPFAIGERGQWRLFNEYAYLAPRNYTGVTARNSGLFTANGMFAPPSGLPTSCYLNPFMYWMPNITDPNWHKTRTVTKWSPGGKEIENIDAVGNYSTALFGYNESLPVAVGANMRQGDILSEGFEDYKLLQYNNCLTIYRVSPINDFTLTALSTGSAYSTYNTSATGLVIDGSNAHTGDHSMRTPVSPDYSFDLPVNDNNYLGMINNYNIYYTNDPVNPYRFTSANDYLDFKIVPGKEYVLSYWIKQGSGSSFAYSTSTGYPLSANCGVTVDGTLCPPVKKTNVIDGWQMIEVKFKATAGSNTVVLPADAFIDDLRVYPFAGNMKAFVYEPFTLRLVATLDENNFATMYEYDQEGTLVRTKKETTKGTMTISESRRGNTKN